MATRVKLVGLDCGTTTTSLVVASARLDRGALTRLDISDTQPIFESDVVFTPFGGSQGDEIDAASLSECLDQWLAASGTASADVFSGGALITGLAAQSSNAEAITRLIEARLADAVIATADDPRLEAWLAFMGNCREISKSQAAVPIVNVDIGGGTTNLALGVDAQVVATCSLFVGARHFQFGRGGYRLERLSHFAAALLESLGIRRSPGDLLSPAEIAAIVAFYVEMIEDAVGGESNGSERAIALRHVQVPWSQSSHDRANAPITLSGGVGQLVYRQLAGDDGGVTTQFGDLGGELAAGIVRSAKLAGRIAALKPQGLGRATVYGLLEHSAQLSGSTLYLPEPAWLPLKNVPIVGCVNARTTADELHTVFELATRGAAGCVRVDVDERDPGAARDLGTRLAGLLAARPLQPGQTLVVLAAGNVGKVLGNYITAWGTLAARVVVIDEIPARDAQFIRLGRQNEGIVPVWLYALR
jgi:ethanolamine utilization protein EutA